MTSKALSDVPPFIHIPLSNEDAFHAIDDMLIARETRRRQLTKQEARRSGVGSNQHPDIEPHPFGSNIGSSQQNMRKNRYVDIIAYDRSRIILEEESGESEYVNATLVREPELGIDVPRRYWIASQAPTNSTVHAFLSLLLCKPISMASSKDSNLPLIRTIVQLTPLVEDSRNKCHPYFPKEIGTTWKLKGSAGNRGVWVKLDSKKEMEGYRESLIQIGILNEQNEVSGIGRMVTHLEYLGWKDYGVPTDIPHFLNFLKSVETINNHSAPILLHCSAGVGRTGTYITIASLIPVLKILRNGDRKPLLPLQETALHAELAPYPPAFLKQRGIERDFVGLTVDGLRDQRCLMVQTSQQLRWCFESLNVAWDSLQNP